MQHFSPVYRVLPDTFKSVIRSESWRIPRQECTRSKYSHLKYGRVTEIVDNEGRCLNLYTVKIMFMPSSEQVDKLWLQQHNPGEVMNTRSKRKRTLKEANVIIADLKGKLRLEKLNFSKMRSSSVMSDNNVGALNPSSFLADFIVSSVEKLMKRCGDDVDEMSEIERKELSEVIQTRCFAHVRCICADRGEGGEQVDGGALPRSLG